MRYIWNELHDWYVLAPVRSWEHATTALHTKGSDLLLLVGDNLPNPRPCSSS